MTDKSPLSAPRTLFHGDTTALKYSEETAFAAFVLGNMILDGTWRAAQIELEKLGRFGAAVIAQVAIVMERKAPDKTIVLLQFLHHCTIYPREPDQEALERLANRAIDIA